MIYVYTKKDNTKSQIIMQIAARKKTMHANTHFQIRFPEVVNKVVHKTETTEEKNKNKNTISVKKYYF